MSGVYPHVTSQNLLDLVTFDVLYVLLMIPHPEKGRSKFIRNQDNLS